MNEKNIDYIASKRAQELVKDAPNPKDLIKDVTDTLNVLTEDGIYAAFLFIFAKVKENQQSLSQNMVQCLKDIFGSQFALNEQRDQLLEDISQNILIDFNRTLLARLTLERFLTYARYHAKAKGG